MNQFQLKGFFSNQSFFRFFSVFFQFFSVFFPIKVQTSNNQDQEFVKLTAFETHLGAAIDSQE